VNLDRLYGRPHLVARAMTFALIASLLSAPSLAGTSTITIDAVGGRRVTNGEVKGTLSGTVLVQGAAVPGSTASTPAAKPLVADAGDSTFAPSGATVTLLAAGFGGVAPYTFAWTANAGVLAGADAPTAQIDTTGVPGGTYSASVTVRDSNGNTASDSVKFAIYSPVTATLLDQTKNDATPGVLSVGIPGTISFPFTVPANTTKFDVLVSWANSLNDYDIRVLRPDGSQETNHGDGAGVPEAVTVQNPVAGTWTLAVDKFTTIGDNVRAQVTGLTAPADPRPRVSSGGPYKFAVGATQAIAGTVTGGQSPVSVGWDTDLDGTLDKVGASFAGAFAEGRQLVTIKATDAAGFERRETTSVLVARPDRLAAVTTAITVVAVNDTGVNPYHLEFSAQTYPDPDVLALTNNFQKHPSEYIPGYPKDAPAIRATLGQGYFPAADAHLWDLKDATHPSGLEYGKLYWIPGTKIIGAIQNGSFSCSNCHAGAHIILDDDGHGSGSTSVSVGNRYGYGPTCLLVISKGLSTALAASAPLPFVDVNSNSWGAVANVPLDLVLSNTADTTRAAVERGETILFAAGNGNGNAFESPSPTYGTATTGPDWNVVVGAVRRDNQRAIIGDGTPAHLSSWGDGNLPSACRTGTVSQCAFGGTSAATPYTAGIFGNVLSQIRRNIGDGAAGPRAGQVVADGFPVAGSAYLADGKLTRAELREAIFKTAFPLNQDNTQSVPIFPFPWTAPYIGDVNVLFEGYGAATPNSAKRAVDVLMGKTPLPVREAEDRWFSIDRQIRDSIWGGYDRNGDGTRDSEAALGAFGLTAASFANADISMLAIKQVGDQINAARFAQTSSSAPNALAYFLHRTSEGEPGYPPTSDDPVTFMDQTDSGGTLGACFENRATTVLAAYRPVGIWPTATDSSVALPAGTSVQVELYLATDQVTVIRPSAVLMAGDRVLGSGAGTPAPTIGSGPWIAQGSPVNPNVVSGAPALPTGVEIDQNKCNDLGELCWNKFTWSFTTTRPAIPGEQLTFQVSLIGARAWAFGYEGQHRSKILIVPGTNTSGLDFGVAISDPSEGATEPDAAFNAYGTATFPQLGTTESGDHPTMKRVDISVDDASFTSPIRATLDEASGTWWAPIPRLAPGAHTLYARAAIDTNTSPAATRHITVQDTRTSPRVQWQVTPRGAAPTDSAWQAASGVTSYAFSFDSRAYGKGDFTIYTRLLEQGVPTASTSVNVKFSGK
jgi:hypothetical protein